MAISLGPRGNAGVVVDTTVSSLTREDVLPVLDTVEDPGLQPCEEDDAQQDLPYSYLFWKAAKEKIANARARLVDR